MAEEQGDGSMPLLLKFGCSCVAAEPMNSHIRPPPVPGEDDVIGF